MGPKQLGAGLLALVAGFAAWSVLSSGPDTAAKAALRLESVPPVPEIGLARLGEVDPAEAAPARDVFQFGRDSRADLAPVPTPVIQLAPVPTPVPTPEAPPTPTPWPLLRLALIGIVDNGAGRKIASFVKDDDILLVGQEGQVLGNAFRVIQIGTETAEIEELGAARRRRLPLRKN